MTDITKLPDKWREDAVEASEQGLLDSGLCIANTCATMLDESLPPWTEITDDPDTWPVYGTEIVVRWKDHVTKGAYFGKGRICYEYLANENITTEAWWRPLCDLDYPNE